jgi:hypothetical protein
MIDDALADDFLFVVHSVVQNIHTRNRVKSARRGYFFGVVQGCSVPLANSLPTRDLTANNRCSSHQLAPTSTGS